ncbi:hypothetical protein LOK49_LG08G01207 [Camellia lanceoleosa]|uniref:Uncharacterized protein n=1 Tax=Camellia lanceoleosa TaxID=1840588 RepID=A0ACC0GRH6_9ERIC|nr:hypothetical protein LOK49_LG08G01207 [Camellia lanceoleosa]
MRKYLIFYSPAASIFAWLSVPDTSPAYPTTHPTLALAFDLSYGGTLHHDPPRNSPNTLGYPQFVWPDITT